MANLIDEIEAFCREQRLSERQFGDLAVKDGKFVSQLRAGRDLRVSTVERVRSFMASYRPEAA